MNERPIVLAEIEAGCAERGIGLEPKTMLAVIAALREMADAVSPGLRRGILARHNIVLDAEGE